MKFFEIIGPIFICSVVNPFQKFSKISVPTNHMKGSREFTNILIPNVIFFQQALPSVLLTLKITQQQFGSKLETLGAIQPYTLAPMPNSQKQTPSFFVETFSTKTLDVENTHSKERLNMIHICWTNLILLAVTKLEITSTFFSVKLQWNT